MNSENKIKVGITHGDYNGIGYEVILKTLEDERMLELMTPVVYGSTKLFNATRKSLNMSQLNFVERKSAAEASENEITVINVVEGDPQPEPGRSTPEAGKAALAALQMAVDDLKSGEIDVLVTASINKHNIQSDEFHFAGHTEFLEEKLGEEGDKALMLLVDGGLRVALVTGHIPVSKVGESVTTDLILEKLDVLNQSLKRDFTIVRPLIAVLALNPHSGDNGLLGDEEQNIIIPAIQEANEKGIMAFGPYSADGFFGSGLHTRFDTELAM
ncbi:MAG: 4-hydroxythreonine-4-phosphate dehydrogenase PdxA [Paramuribaculum sp.]|nr:4-hydroxythreonine-4-phosphate dehydrogenase PdxA [Paramuribaculum sp.]